jgi:hypothetical protein
MASGDPWTDLVLLDNVTHPGGANGGRGRADRWPFTALGINYERDVMIFAVIDGRGISNGVNTYELGDLMRYAGAWTAIGLDCGGSSAMYIEPHGLVNFPSEGGIERPVGNGVFLISTAPDCDEIAMIKPHTPVINIPVHGEYIPKFYGYNKFGTLINTDLQGAVLTCDPSLGTIVGNKFVAGGNNASGIITATYGSATTEIRVNFIEVSDIAIRLDSVIVDTRTNYAIEVVATTVRGTSPISPLALTWTVDNPEILEVIDGQIHALKNGVTIVRGTMDGVSDEIQVSVEIPTSAVMLAARTELANWTMTVSSQYRDEARLNEENLPENWDTGIAVNFVHRSGISPSINLANKFPFYGLPDTVKIVLNIGDIILANNNAVGISLRANNTTRLEIYSRVPELPANQDYSIVIPLDEVFDTADRAIYPVWFENINFLLRTGSAGMTVGRAYTLAIREIQLVYAGILQTNIPVVNSRPAFFIFPNPAASGTLNLLLSENMGQTVRTEIYNLAGQLLSSKRHGVYNGVPLSLSIQHLPQGTYLLRVFENEKSDTMQFIVK